MTNGSVWNNGPYVTSEPRSLRSECVHTGGSLQASEKFVRPIPFSNPGLRVAASQDYAMSPSLFVVGQPVSGRRRIR